MDSRDRRGPVAPLERGQGAPDWRRDHHRRSSSWVAALVATGGGAVVFV